MSALELRSKQLEHKPTSEYEVQVTPVDAGYALAVESLRQFMVVDGYEGSLDQVARGLIATEVGQPVDSITVHLRYDLMSKFRRPSQFSWPILLLGVATLSVAAMGLVLLNPFLASLGGFGALALVVARLVGPKDEGRSRVE